MRKKSILSWHEHAFSLVELSIVLVILGLLAGGVLSGQSLIRAAELRSVAADSERYMTAVMSFRDKYFALPGDMNNATQFWGSAGGAGHTLSTDPICQTTATGDTRTCDGDGDGLITSSSGIFFEGVRAWQHLANAGLVEGSYSGVPNAASPLITLGVNAPTSKISNAGFTIASMCPGMFAGDPANPGTGQCWGPQSIASVVIFFGGAGNTTRNANILKPEEAWNVDIKLDDGRPDTGNVQSGSSVLASGLPGCYSSFNSPSAYSLTVTDKVCNLGLIAVH